MTRTDITNELAFDLYARWEAAQNQGRDIALEEFCAPHPELLTDVRKIARQLSSKGAPAGAGSGDDAPPPEAPPVANRVPPDWTEIGRGASSVVYCGQDPTFGTAVAFKVLQTQGRALAPQDVARLMKRFEQEARILARLKHDGIVRIFKTFDLGGHPVIEMEHLPNGSLATHLKAVRARGAVEIARFMERVARAVGFAHGHRIVHRDLKPSNILLDDTGRPCVSDFGVAKLIHPGDLGGPVGEPTGSPGDDTDAEMACLTAAGRQPGTRAYMAPEQFDEAFGEIKPETDVWALGVVLYELVNGTRPFACSTPDEWAEAICRGPLPRSRWLPWRRVNQLEAIALRCLTRKQEKRYPSASAVADALAAVARPVWRKMALVGGILAVTAACIVALTRPVPVSMPAPAEQSLPHFDREAREAFQFCTEGKVSKGLFAFADLLKRVPEDSYELRTAIRANIAAWSQACAQVDGLYTHSDPISAVTASGDGRWVAIGDERGGVVLWDATTGRAHARPGAHSRRVMSAAFSRDGHFFVTGSEDQTVRVWPVEGFATAVPKSIPVGGWVFAVGFTPDGEHVVTGTQWREVAGVRFWSTRSGAESKSAPSLKFPRAFATAPDGRELVVLNTDGSAEVWDLERRCVRGALAVGSRAAVRSAAYAPDGKTIATGGDSLQFWDAETCQLKSDEHRDAVAVLGFATNGESVAVRAPDELRVWQPAANCFDPLPTLRPAPPDVQIVSGTHLIGTEAGITVVRLRWPVTGVRSLPIPRTCAGRALNIDGDGSCAAVVTDPDASKGMGERDAGIDLWDIRSGRRVGRPIRPPGHPVMGMGFGPNRGQLAFYSRSTTVERPVLSVDAAGDRPDGELRGHRGGVYCIRFLRTPGEWVTAGQDGDLRVWSPAGEPRDTIALPAGATGAHVGPGDRQIAVSCANGSVVCVDLKPKLTVRWTSPPGSPCTQIMFSPNGNAVVARGRDGRLRAWGATNGVLISALPEMAGIRTVAPSGDGPGWVTCHHDGAVRRWAELTATAPDWDWTPSEGDPVISVDPTGAVLVTGNPDGKAQAWSTATRLPLGPPVRHDRRVFASAWAGQDVVTLSEKSARVWAPLDARTLPKETDLVPWLNAVTSANRTESSQ